MAKFTPKKTAFGKAAKATKGSNRKTGTGKGRRGGNTWRGYTGGGGTGTVSSVPFTGQF
jgi:hypothetical protein